MQVGALERIEATADYSLRLDQENVYQDMISDRVRKTRSNLCREHLKLRSLQYIDGPGNWAPGSRFLCLENALHHRYHEIV